MLGYPESHGYFSGIQVLTRILEPVSSFLVERVVCGSGRVWGEGAFRL